MQGVWNEQMLDANLGSSLPSSFSTAPMPSKDSLRSGATCDVRRTLEAGNQSAHPTDHRNWFRDKHET